MGAIQNYVACFLNICVIRSNLYKRPLVLSYCHNHFLTVRAAPHAHFSSF